MFVVGISDSAEEEKNDKIPLPRKRRWGSSKSNRPVKKPVLINTDCLKVGRVIKRCIHVYIYIYI